MKLGPLLNIKSFLFGGGGGGMEIPMLKIKQSQDHLIFNIQNLYIESAPRFSW